MRMRGVALIPTLHFGFILTSRFLSGAPTTATVQ